MWTETGLWADVREMPEALAATLDAADGLKDTARLLANPDVTRIVVSGNGAAYYVALALWLASLHSHAPAPEVVAVPSGLLASGWFRFRRGDRLLAVSSSGEFRDLVEAIDSGAPKPYAAITATAGSSVEKGSGARALQRVLHQRAVTHTQALANAVACALWIWADVTDDEELRRAVGTAPEALERIVAGAERWGLGLLLERPAAAIAFSPGPGWAAAAEAALLLKEISRVPCEGVESREGATSAMFGLAPGHLALSLPVGGDRGLAETERLCAGAGATLVRLPGGEAADPRLAVVSTLPAACAVSAVLAGLSGHDVDRPDWVEAYESTARGTE